MKTFNWHRYYVSLPKETSPDLATVIKVVPTANNGSPELLKLHHEQVSVLVVSGVISATESEAEESGCFQIVRVRSRSGRINQSQCMFPRFVIGLVPLLLLPTPTVWFSLDHKPNIRDGVIRGIRTLFSLDHKLYASDYDSDFDSDSDSVASENQS